MLKKRIIASLVVKNGIVVQSLGFNRYLPVGSPEIAVEFLNNWGIDEIILIDIEAAKEERSPNIEMIKRVSRNCYVPLTVGGGIKDIEDVKRLIRNGADKITINKAAVDNPKLLKEAANMFGRQCIVVSIDAKKTQNNSYEVFIDNGKVAIGLSPSEHAKIAEKMGAGEILLNSIDNDGMKTGYDIDLINQVVEAVSIPVIACGGAGHPQHFLDCFINTKVAALAAGNYFHFTEHSPIITKSYLYQNNYLGIRLETYATYRGSSFDGYGRLDKRNDQYLDKLRFEYQPKEII